MLDLLDQDGTGSSSPNTLLDVIQQQIQPRAPTLAAQLSQEAEEEKQSANGGAQRYYKDSNRKQSQANQKKRQPGDD